MYTTCLTLVGLCLGMLVYCVETEILYLHLEGNQKLSSERLEDGCVSRILLAMVTLVARSRTSLGSSRDGTVVQTFFWHRRRFTNRKWNTSYGERRISHPGPAVGNCREGD